MKPTSRRSRSVFSLEQWTKMLPTEFDLRAEYWAEIHPRVEALLEVCTKYDLPMVAYLCVHISAKEGEILAAHHTPEDLGRLPAEMLLRLPNSSATDAKDMVCMIADIMEADEIRTRNAKRAQAIAETATRQ